VGIILVKKEYLNRFFYRIMESFYNCGVDGKVYCWYGISARLLNIL